MKILSIVSLLVLLTACQNKTNEFAIAHKQVGKITDTTTVAQMKQLYQNDSIVKTTEGAGAFEPYDEYIIIDKNTKDVLMVVIPKKINDEQSKIKRVEIKSPKFKTDKGVGLSSSFGDFKKHHKIGRIDETFKYIVVFIDDLNATINMPKDVIPLNARNDSSIKVDETLIPDQSKIKDFIVFIND
ncbi:MAG TPA: hypothetical protein ENK64_02895 [Flavobacteriales bacterium]|jgi:hypothetical protein|nr:hypothetical protein [Flavobacteriales bacterium]